MKHQWKKDYEKSCRAFSLEGLLDELLSVAWSMESPVKLANFKDQQWKIAFLRKEIIARYKNK